MKTIDELLNDFAVDSGFEDYLDYQNSLTMSDGEWMEICEKYAEQFKPKWISVEERLPEEGGRYWCYCEELNDLVISCFEWNCYYDPQAKEFRDNHEKYYVTHWTNLLGNPA